MGFFTRENRPWQSSSRYEVGEGSENAMTLRHIYGGDFELIYNEINKALWKFIGRETRWWPHYSGTRWQSIYYRIPRTVALWPHPTRYTGWREIFVRPPLSQGRIFRITRGWFHRSHTLNYYKMPLIVYGWGLMAPAMPHITTVSRKFHKFCAVVWRDLTVW